MKFRPAVALILAVFAQAALPAHAKSPSLADLEKRDAAKIERLHTAERRLSELQAELARAYDSGERRIVLRLHGQVSEAAREVNRARAKLRQYLATRAEHDLIAELQPRVRDGASRQDLEGALRCLNSLSRETDELAGLARQATDLLKRVDPNAALRLTRGYRERMCSAPSVTTECWESLYGDLVYVTKGRMRIHSRCLTALGTERYSRFPTEPKTFLEAANAATRAVSGCYRGLNRERAVDLANFIATRRPLMLCSPEGAPTPGDTECAHASYGSSELVLTRPNDCGNLGATLFHELLHCGGEADNLPTRSHNSSSCRRFDAVYACEQMCFPRKRATRMHERACLGCVSEERRGRCAGTNASYDNEVISCGALSD